MMFGDLPSCTQNLALSNTRMQHIRQFEFPTLFRIRVLRSEAGRVGEHKINDGSHFPFSNQIPSTCVP